MAPAELEFLAEDTPIRISPFFESGPLRLLVGMCGPFRTGTPIEVPVWLAVTFAKRKKCNVEPPDWMTVEVLEAIREWEQHPDHAHELSPDLPFHYFELASLLLTLPTSEKGCLVFRANDNPNHVRTLVDELQMIRLAKLAKTGLRILHRMPTMRLLGVCAMELNVLRPQILHTRDAFNVLDPPSEMDTQDSSLQTPDESTYEPPQRKIRRTVL
eukprot:gnl/Spiro4/9730_TR5176_c0_g1_i1.p1 gnl/Spiro4/9730_TR5176_c0_g1~~gnl/Spiro4/9730_TR5176_c0_g1_i1.p1  ORF type:complete len:214 (-),score=26.10 gnl/Spiro4/9730_TR5176_c0_g1_i1:115-756(-)